MFGLDEDTYRLLIFVLLLVIFGIVSFNAYSFISAKDGISLGAGYGFQIPSRREKFRV
uniref:Transmembrane protein n=1 Tax=Mimivirus LCMiAC01 TaxID=2506608 RepID=A0A481YYZ0_9VIRU|nr:MAG: hypothetical protein LCMiAC01_00720 [Mimivirus LCMiAC01]